jgi:hypothetical protein
MSRENDTSQEPWEEPAEKDGYEGKTQFQRRPRSSRDAYDNPSARIRQRPRQTGDPRDTGKNRPGPYEESPRRHAGPPRANEPRQQYDAYGRPRQGTRSPREPYESSTEPPRERPRQTRDSRERPVSSDKVDEGYQQRHRISRHSREEAYARLRQRPRQPGYSREEVYGAYPDTQQRSRPIIDPEIEELDRRALRPRSTTLPPQRPVIKRRRAWSTLLIGCIGGIVTIALIAGVIAFIVFRTIPLNIGGIGKTSFTKQLQQQPLPISSSIKQLQVNNRVGNISIRVDPAATKGTLTGVMKVQASNSSDAAKEFGRIAVDVKPGSDPSVLTVNANVPGTSGALLAGSSDSVDLTIVLPSSVNNIPPFTLKADVAATGDIAVQNFNGVLTLTDNTGNITVQHGLLAAGSCLQTNNGNITLGGGSILNLIYASQLIPCTTNTTQNPHPWFSIKSGTGNVDVTLGTESTNVILDANTNNGKINNDFGLNVQQNSDGSATYHGPLIPGSSPTALLVLTVSTGNINLHKAA